MADTVASGLLGVGVAYLLSVLGGIDAREINVAASPGLTTLLDTALYRSNEGCLTATVCAADSVLATILELKRLAKALLKAVLLSEADLKESYSGKSTKGGSSTNSSSNKRHSINGNAVVLRELAESFARLCLECANGCIEKMTCDQFARSANLDVYHFDNFSTYCNNMNVHTNNVTSNSGDSGTSAFITDTSMHAQAKQQQCYNILCFHENARHKQPKSSDCWESPRLFCPDYIWADEAVQYCLKALRIITKHRFLSTDKISNINLDSISIESQQTASWMWPNLPPSCLQLADQIYHLIRLDLPAKLCQFRTAIESETIVSKRLYLVKCEYRAPFRAFLESLNLVLKAPSLNLVREYIQLHKPNTNKTPPDINPNTSQHPSETILQDSNSTCTPELQKRQKKTEQEFYECLHHPYLVKALKMEQHLEMLEIGMSQLLLPFTDLARLLDNKKCRIVPCTSLLEPKDVPAIRELVYRLKSTLVQNIKLYHTYHNNGQVSASQNLNSSNHSIGSGNVAGSGNNHSNCDDIRSSCGIRPILVDIQGMVPRDNSEIDPFAKTIDSTDIITNNDFIKEGSGGANELIQSRLERFLTQLQTLSMITKTKGALHFLEKREYEIPPSLIQKCNAFDSELFEAQFQDWWTLVQVQHKYLCGHREECTNNDIEEKCCYLLELARETRQKEMDMSLAMSSLSSLMNIQQKLENYEMEANKRFDVLRETVVDVALREMNLKVFLEKPKELVSWNDDSNSNEEDPKQKNAGNKTINRVLEIKETSAMGLFGDRLLAAGEKLPIG